MACRSSAFQRRPYCVSDKGAALWTLPSAPRRSPIGRGRAGRRACRGDGQGRRDGLGQGLRRKGRGQPQGAVPHKGHQAKTRRIVVRRARGRPKRRSHGRGLVKNAQAGGSSPEALSCLSKAWSRSWGIPRPRESMGGKPLTAKSRSRSSREWRPAALSLTLASRSKAARAVFFGLEQAGENGQEAFGEGAGLEERRDSARSFSENGADERAQRTGDAREVPRLDSMGSWQKGARVTARSPLIGSPP